jgi:glycosyltransferase involved in cell wall biosynthesis
MLVVDGIGSLQSQTLTPHDQPPRSGGRVALLFASFSGGGVERSMLRLGDAFMARGLNVDLVVGQAKGELRADVSPGARIVELSKTPVWRTAAQGLRAGPHAWRLLLGLEGGGLKRLWRRLPAVVDYLNDARPGAVLAAEPRYNAMAAWARRLSRLDCRIVLSEHNQASSHASGANSWVDRRALPLLRDAYLAADAIATASIGVADDLAAHTGIPRDRITTVYNPVVAADMLGKARKPVDHPWFAAGEPPVVLGVGRLHPQKDFATLIRSFAKLRSRRPLRLVILGAGTASEYAVALRALATKLGVAHDVEMPGFAHNPLAFMSRAAVFVLSSRYEGLGNVLIEALACGTPVVSTDCPSGPAEVLDKGRFGPLVPVGDVAALARAIERVLDHPPTAESLRARGELFSVERSADGYLKLLLPAQDEIRLAEDGRS